MYEIIALLLFVSQIQNVSIIYAVEIQLVKQKLQQYTRNVVKKTRDIYRSWYEYFYPVEKITKKEIRTIPYEDKYKEKFRLLANDEVTGDLKNNILIEETPIGNVIMFYNPENFRFEFYAEVPPPTTCNRFVSGSLAGGSKAAYFAHSRHGFGVCSLLRRASASR